MPRRMPLPTQATALVTLRDVAELAHVQRPVVSMWRSRFATSARPFPSAAGRREGREVFSLADVVAWLGNTGHGNNPAVRDDAAAAAALEVIPVESRAVVFEGLAALLALKAVLGTPLGGLARHDLTDLADEVDPHDLCLFREIDELGADAPSWAEHADALASAAFTPAAAAENLAARRRRLGLDGGAQHSFASPLLGLVGRLTAQLGPSTLIAPHGDADLLLAVGADTGEPGTAELPRPTTPAGRQARRMLLTYGWELRDLVADGRPAAGSIVLVALPAPTLPHLTDDGVIDAVGEVEATLPADVRAIVVGPASVLCDRLPAHRQAARASLLRSGRVHAVVRLPAGLRPARTRERLGLWLLGAPTGDVRSPAHRTATADVSGTALDAAAIDDLVTDLLAAAPDGDGGRAHAFRFTRLTTTSALIATSGPLVNINPPSRRPRSAPAALAATIAAGYAAATAITAELAPWQASPGEAAGPVLVPLGRLVQDGHLTLMRGTRFDEADLSQGGVTVHTATTLSSPGSSRGIDRVRLAVSYPRSRDTRPGDVVFCGGPQPAAIVDHEGLGAVAAPARVLRLSASAPAGLVPEVVAHAIRSAGHGDWRRWLVPIVPTSQAHHVGAALRGIDDARAAAAARLAALDELSAALVEATSTGAVTLLPPARTTPMEG